MLLGESPESHFVVPEDNIEKRTAKDGKEYYVVVSFGIEKDRKFPGLFPTSAQKVKVIDNSEYDEMAADLKEIKLALDDVNKTYDSMERSLKKVTDDTKARDVITQLQKSQLNA